MNPTRAFKNDVTVTVSHKSKNVEVNRIVYIDSLSLFCPELTSSSYLEPFRSVPFRSVLPEVYINLCYKMGQIRIPRWKRNEWFHPAILTIGWIFRWHVLQELKSLSVLSWFHLEPGVRRSSDPYKKLNRVPHTTTGEYEWKAPSPIEVFISSLIAMQPRKFCNSVIRILSCDTVESNNSTFARDFSQPILNVWRDARRRHTHTHTQPRRRATPRSLARRAQPLPLPLPLPHPSVGPSGCGRGQKVEGGNGRWVVSGSGFAWLRSGRVGRYKPGRQ